MVMNESERGRGVQGAGSSSASKYRSRNTHTVHHHRHYNIFLVLIHECNAGESGERGTVEERARRSMTAKQLRRRVKIVESKVRLKRQEPLERDINIAVNECSGFATSTQKGPFTAMLISGSRGTCLIGNDIHVRKIPPLVSMCGTF